ncbi:MAG: tetratricopeptide repeat protein [Acidobacteriota bacterium]
MTRSARCPVRAALLMLFAAGCSGGPTGPPEPARPRDSLRTILTHADNAFREGDYVEAQSTYEQALQINPEDRHVIPRLGTCYLKNRLIRRAEDLLVSHLTGDPDDVRARLVLARVYIHQARLQDAGRELEIVLEAYPDNLLARYNLGFIAYRSRRYGEAETHLKRTIELAPRHPEAHYTLGLTYLAQNRVDEAVASLERAVEIDPRHVAARFNLARAYARAGRLDQAEEQNRIYAELSGSSAAAQERDAQIRAQSLKAVQYRQEGRFDQALAEYRALAERFPDHPPLLTEIGRLELRLGRRDDARRTLERAVALDPGLSEPHYLLAGIYRQAGDAAAADREMEVFNTLESIAEGKGRY